MKPAQSAPGLSCSEVVAPHTFHLGQFGFLEQMLSSVRRGVMFSISSLSSTATGVILGSREVPKKCS